MDANFTTQFKMKHITYFALTFFCLNAGFAQESDSTFVEEKVAPIVDQGKGNNIIETKTSTEVSDKTEVNTDDSESDVQPRIIYYPNENASNTNRYKSNSRERNSDIKTLSGNMSHSGGFWGVSFRTTEFRDEATVMAGMRAGWIINRTLGIGVEGHGIIPTAKFDDVTNDGRVVLLGGYGGMFMEFIVFSNQVVHLTFPVSGGAGWVGYNRDWEDEFLDPNDIPDPLDPDFNTSQSGLIDGDVFWYVEPGVNIELNVARHFRMDFGVSKRFTQDMELVNTETDAFEKLTYYVTLKVGRF